MANALPNTLSLSVSLLQIYCTDVVDRDYVLKVLKYFFNYLKFKVDMTRGRT